MNVIKKHRPLFPLDSNKCHGPSVDCHYGRRESTPYLIKNNVGVVCAVTLGLLRTAKDDILFDVHSEADESFSQALSRGHVVFRWACNGWMEPNGG